MKNQTLVPVHYIAITSIILQKFNTDFLQIYYFHLYFYNMKLYKISDLHVLYIPATRKKLSEVFVLLK